jgi:excisionase family DNA binding protein
MSSSDHQFNLSIADRIDAMDHALTVKELAPLLNLSSTSLYNRAREGCIPSYRIGGSVRFDPHTTAEWLRAQECKAA